MKILIINGPNLNILGVRDPSLYGSETLESINKEIEKKASVLNIEVEFFQSNHEGFLIDFIQQEYRNASGIIINPGAFTHYSYALHDALVDTKLPVVEVHLSDISSREEWRKISVIKPATVKQVMGKKGNGYIEALDFLVEYIGNKN